jgi:hypothetical protein
LEVKAMSHRHYRDNVLFLLIYLICLSQAARYARFPPP